MEISRVPARENPRLFDRVIVELQQGLADNIAWLDHIFGRAERVVEKRNGVRTVIPAVYIGNNDYRNITPDDKAIGNYAFFTIDDPQNVEYAAGVGRAKAGFSLVVWLDMRTIESIDDRNVEAVKSELLKALTHHIRIKSGAVRIHRVYEHPEAVFTGFSYDHLDAQALMHPYCGLRFSGEIITNDNCVW